ncbi:hypothetical protein Q3G72_027732 [Acer saccharum]|nr:hypothetical protein Q3G72_027732 [Acer saccharum]
MLTQLLQTQYSDTTVAQWLAAAIVTLVVTFVLRSITRVVHTRLADSAPQTDSLVDDVVLDMARRTFFVFQLAMGVAASSWFLNVPQHWDERIRMGVMLLAILQAGVWGSGIVNYVIVALLDRRGSPNDAAHRTGRAMLRFLGLAIVWSSVLLLSLDNLGVSVTTLIAGLGVTGIAVALATQQIFGDLFASVSILLDKPFLVGDFINLETFYGTVERIGIRSTRLRSLSGECLIFANSDLSKSRVRNFADLKERRIVWNFGLRHDTPVEKPSKSALSCRLLSEKFPRPALTAPIGAALAKPPCCLKSSTTCCTQTTRSTWTSSKPSTANCCVHCMRRGSALPKAHRFAGCPRRLLQPRLPPKDSGPNRVSHLCRHHARLYCVIPDG